MRNLGPSARRGLTVVAVGLSLIVGFGAIRAASAWTAAEAPLVAAPVSVEALQAGLIEGSARSADVMDKVAALETHADELSAALAAAEATLTADTAHAAQLATDLGAAKAKLAALELSIRKASTSQVVAGATRTTRTGSAPAADGEREGPGDD